MSGFHREKASCGNQLVTMPVALLQLLRFSVIRGGIQNIA